MIRCCHAITDYSGDLACFDFLEHTQSAWQSDDNPFGQQHLMVNAELIILKYMFRAKWLIGAVWEEVGGVFQTVGGATASPAVVIAHVRAQTCLVRHRNVFPIWVNDQLRVVSRDVGAVAISVK